MAAKKRIGIVLFQLGGPDSLQAVEPFLLNLFLDPDIIPMGPLGFLRRPMAKMIASFRARCRGRAERRVLEMGAGTGIFTRRLAEMLEQPLRMLLHA